MLGIARAALLASITLLIAARAGAEPQLPVPAGNPMADHIAFEFAVYLQPGFKGDAEKILGDEARALDPQLQVLKQVPKTPPAATVVAVRLERDVPHHYAVPDLESLHYFGRGISREQAEAVQHSQLALVLDFAHPRSQVWSGLRAANQLVERVARKTGGLIWDDGTRLLYSPDEWRAQEVDSWNGEPPLLLKYYTIHAYKTETYIRAITLGMAKFGLPDIVVNQFSWDDNDPVGNLINLFAQAMAEGARFGQGGRYELNIASIHNVDAREAQLKSLKHGAVAAAHLTLLRGVHEEGDPQNRLVEIGFDQYPGSDLRERQDAMLSALFGAEDSVVQIRHNAELLAASEKARAHLPALQKAFNAGLPPGDLLELKAPFDVPDGGHEYMWVEVTRWYANGTIQGLLHNEPEKVPKLHAGEPVTIQQGSVFDYLLQHSDGSREGNETGVIITRMQRESGDQGGT